ncbi:endonuclease [uncultured Winogradskyella sp.]|uniref:endonuclease n=1 Tax=uncultured Winogradskyella sp. TaxID=395353 RepID=UPI00262E427B|nr:endonuclease [uncultured Winogradskyella sp.]
MKQLYTTLFLIFGLITFSQQAYYTNGQNNIDFTLTGDNMYNALQTKISNNFNTSYTYGDIRDDFKIMDLDPTNADNVLLLYGSVNNVNCSATTDRRIRDKDDFGGSNCDYNREHIFARSNANPGMGSTSNSFTGIVADPHNLRPTDVQRNGNRGSKKFADGTGNSGDVGSGNWYPGDEWKGDVARAMMYMYVRYGDRCLPSLNGSGPTQPLTDMLQIYLEWNEEDPVSDIENNRNDHLENVYGNRNPFVDNPYLAKIIWGGDEEPEDTWGILSVDQVELDTVLSLYPNPAKDIVNVNISNNIETRIEIYDVLGKRIFIRKVNESMPIDISSLKSGIYLFKFIQENNTSIKKLIIQ